MKFNDPSNLRKHIKNIHKINDSLKPFICKHCKKQFNRKESLQKHFQTHLKVKDRKLYHCQQCNICFTFKSNLNKHSKKFH